jgi:diaminopimelate decarboxylase
MKRAYEKPVIRKYTSGIANKMGAAGPVAVQDNIEGVGINDLIRDYGSPLFVYSEKVIRETYEKLIHAFSARYPRVQAAWSYKTNYLQAVCRSFHKLGSWAEVVSSMEYDMARGLGMEGEQIIFNGPYKPYNALRKAVLDGAMINIDGLDEMRDLELISEEIGSTVNAGIRLNMSLGTYMAWDRFGFNLDTTEAYEAVKMAASKGKVKIKGIHAHIGTFILEPDYYRAAVYKVAEFALSLKKELGIKVEYIDIGGGFASHNDLKGAYLPTSETAPHFEQYAEAICSPLLSAFPPDELPLLILETGRALIDEAGYIVSTVVATKRLGSGQRALILDAGVNLLFTAFWYNHEVVPAVNRGFPMDDHIIYGPLCMQIDVIRESIKLPYLEKGDKVLIRPVGAYNNTQWMQFIHLRPNVVMISEKKDVSVIRKAETLDYLQSPESLPEWLTD